MTDSTVTADREELFAKLADPATTGKFFERVSDSVSWTVEGTHPLAGTYTSKQAFFDSTFTILGPLMRDGLRLEVQNLHIAGDYTIAELHDTAGYAVSTVTSSSRSARTSIRRWSPTSSAAPTPCRGTESRMKYSSNG
jgi:hypothetical protein